MSELSQWLVFFGSSFPNFSMRTFFSSTAASVAFLIPMLANAVGLQVIVNGQALVFVDVSQSAWFTTYVRDAAEAGIVNGYMDANGKFTGKFGPENDVTMAEALKIASESSGYDEHAYGAVVDSGVKHWSSAYVSVARAEHFEILNNPYRLDRPATRAEVASMVASAFRVTVPASPSGTTFKDVQFSVRYAASIEALERDGVVSGDTDMKGEVTGTFRPTSNINRAEVVKIAMGARAKYGQPGKDRTPIQPTSSNTVTYANGTFSPSVLSVPVGTMVTFHNGSMTPMWVASNPHPTHTDYPGFDSLKEIAPGQDYSFTFTKTGTWGYHNHLNRNEVGTISVQ